ncbi:hypothetical protein EMMF5_000651 [Cystobasidiomycetes sp. EMM_F5]
MAIAMSHYQNAGASTSSAVVAPGSRAAATRAIITKASQKVIERVTLDAMQQSFPDFADSDAEFIQSLTDKTRSDLQAGFDQAWQTFFEDSEFRDFIARANEVDRVYAAATQRLSRREAPQDAWKQGRDPVLAIRATVMPKLLARLDSLRDTRADLAAQSEDRMHRIRTLQAENDVLEADAKAMLASVAEANKNLTGIDAEAVSQLVDSITPLLEADKL